MGKIYCIPVIFTVVLILGGCGYSGSGPEGAEQAVSERYASGDTEAGLDGGEETREEAPEQEEALGQEAPGQEAARLAEDMDFTIQKSVIDRERYDQQADRLYKGAFLKALTNQIPIRGQGGEELYFYRDLLGEAGKLPEDQFLKAVRESDYFYQDYDGDGLPELTVDTEGSCVLKYDLEKDQVELCARKEDGWHLLGEGQMYARFMESHEEIQTSLYCYEAGEEKFCLKDILSWHDGWQQEPYLVSIGEYEDMAVGEETALKLLEQYFAAIEQAPHPVSFSVLFGDEEGRGSVPGEEAPVRYGLRDTDLLPINEETGQEWEAYKAMMEGDFSVVEDERWVSLQGQYEEELENGGGTCGWSYFLMDFNQDGVRELVIRLYPDGVNNTASFCWEDGHVKMWGSYGSGDSHGYEVPLANGKILSVYWYQNDWQWWVNRVDSQCRRIREQGYRGWESREDFFDDEERERFFEFQDYYYNGESCGSAVSLTEEEWGRIEEVVNGLMLPESVWKPCSVFTPRADRPEVPGVG